MVLVKEVMVNVFSKTLTYYRKKGYDVKYGEAIMVKVEDLHEKTTVKINVKCDNCDSEKNMEYRLYNNNLIKYGLYYCNKCKHLKSKKTKLILYGDENYNNTEKHELLLH